MTKKLAVIGAGPKGAAIAAKAAALRQVGLTPPDVFVYEQDAAGAAWTGKSGYTDGDQPLCTLAERDLGFPYDRQAYGAKGRDVADAMLARFSWHAFAVGTGSGAAEYGHWVVHGRKPPAHRDFARYLEFAITNSGATLVNEEVFQLDYDTARGLWRVASKDLKGNQRDGWFDGVVVTGSGPSLRPMAGAAGSGRVFDSKGFWLNLPVIANLLSADPDPSIVIVGAGGTAAAIAHWFIRRGIRTVPIKIIGREPTLYARHHGVFEDRLFTDEAAWAQLADHVKDAFLARLTSGVVWDDVLRNLASDNITYESFDVLGFKAVPGSPPSVIPPELMAELDHPPDPNAIPPAVRRVPVALRPATVFIDARGFDRWWFVDAFLKRSTLSGHLVAAHQRAMQSNIDDAFAFVGKGFPWGLHVPMLASRQGPAATNLMAMGWMSDRILRRY